MNNEILFLTDNPDLSRGSYRIWINDLNLYLRDGSISSVINDNPSKYDIIILDKNFDYSFVQNAVKHGVGLFRPPSIGKTLINQLIARYNVPSEIVTKLDAELTNFARQAIPLLEIEEKSENE